MTIKIWAIHRITARTTNADKIADDMTEFMDNETCRDCSYSLHIGGDLIVLDYMPKDHPKQKHPIVVDPHGE